MGFALLAFALASVESPMRTVALTLPAGHRDGERTAVCVTGELRTHYHPRIQQDLKENFHRDGYEYFFSNNIAVEPTKTALNPIRAIITATKDAMYLYNKDSTVNTSNLISTKWRHSLGDNDQCPPGSDYVLPKGFRKLFVPMTSRYVDCYNAMLAEEEAKGFEYDYVMRIRADHFFDKKTPSPREMLKKAGKQVIFFDDHISLAERKYGDVVLYNPWKVPQDCHTPSDCERVCEDDMCRHTNCGLRGQWLNLATKYGGDIPSHRVFTFFDASVFESDSVGLVWEKGHKHCGGDGFDKPWFKTDGDYCYLSYFR